jgi:hypothetical protein
MFQRIQTVYMGIILIALISLLFFPIVQYNHDVQGTYILYFTGMKYMIDPPVTVRFWQTFPLLLLASFSFVLVGTAIFLYKKRMQQLWLINISFLLHVIMILLLFFYYVNHFEKLFNTLPAYKAGIFIPLISLVCLVLASRAIRKDEALVKSTDRLR